MSEHILMHRHGGPTPGEVKLHQACHRNLMRVAEALQHDCSIPPGVHSCQ